MHIIYVIWNVYISICNIEHVYNINVIYNMYIIFICNKMNDINKSYRDKNGNIVSETDESEPYNGSIINAFLYSSI